MSSSTEEGPKELVGSGVRRSCLKVKTLEESLLSCSTLGVSTKKSSSRYSIARSLHSVRRASVQMLLEGARRSSQLLHPRRNSTMSLHIRTDLDKDENRNSDVSRRTCLTSDDHDDHQNPDKMDRTKEIFVISPSNDTSLDSDTNKEDDVNDSHNRQQAVSPFSNSHKKESVKFGQVEVRLYDMSLSDNPAVSHGPAVQLGWEYEQERIKSVEEYESSRSECSRNSAKCMDALKLSEFERLRILRKCGYDTNEIRVACQAINRARNLRQKTVRKINAAVADGTLIDLDNRVPMRYKIAKVASCAVCTCRRQSKFATAVAY